MLASTYAPGVTRTYDELSKEFKELHPLAVRAFQLIPEMYNWLTLVDGFSHKDASKKITEDHKGLHGFSPKNIRRYLPDDNPVVHRRVRTSRPNTSINQSLAESKLSNTKGTCETLNTTANVNASSKECPDCQEYKRQLEEVTEALKKMTIITKADKLNSLHGLVPKDKEQIVLNAFHKSMLFTRLTFGSDAILFEAIPDRE